jgi:hypothetical protein
MDHFERNKDFFQQAELDKEGKKKAASPIVLT